MAHCRPIGIFEALKSAVADVSAAFRVIRNYQVFSPGAHYQQPKIHSFSSAAGKQNCIRPLAIAPSLGLPYPGGPILVGQVFRFERGFADDGGLVGGTEDYQTLLPL